MPGTVVIQQRRQSGPCPKELLVSWEVGDQLREVRARLPADTALRHHESSRLGLHGGKRALRRKRH